MTLHAPHLSGEVGHLTHKMKHAVVDAPMVDKRDRRVAKGCILTILAAILSVLLGIAAIPVSARAHHSACITLGILAIVTVPITNLLVLWWPSTFLTFVNIVANIIVVPSVASSFRDLAHAQSELNESGCGGSNYNTPWGASLNCNSAKKLVPAMLTIFVLLFVVQLCMCIGTTYVSYVREREGLAVQSRLPVHKLKDRILHPRHSTSHKAVDDASRARKEVDEAEKDVEAQLERTTSPLE